MGVETYTRLIPTFGTERPFRGTGGDPGEGVQESTDPSLDLD